MKKASPAKPIDNDVELIALPKMREATLVDKSDSAPTAVTLATPTLALRPSSVWSSIFESMRTHHRRSGFSLSSTLYATELIPLQECDHRFSIPAQKTINNLKINVILLRAECRPLPSVSRILACEPPNGGRNWPLPVFETRLTAEVVRLS